MVISEYFSTYTSSKDNKRIKQITFISNFIMIYASNFWSIRTVPKCHEPQFKNEEIFYSNYEINFKSCEQIIDSLQHSYITFLSYYQITINGL